MEKKLPGNLTYLEPIINQLKAFDPEELGDENPDAMDIVEAGLKDSFRGMNITEVKDKIQKDCQTMQELMEDPENIELNYVFGVMFGISMYGGIESILS